MTKAQEQKITIKTSNLEAHLTVVKQEITKENNSLNRVVSERKLVEAQIARSTREVKLAEEAYVKTVAKTEQELNKVSTSKEQLATKEEAIKADKARLSKDKVDFEDSKKWELTLLEDEKDIIRDDIAELTNYVSVTQNNFATEEKDYERQILTLEGEASTKQDQLDNVSAELNASVETLSEVRKDILSVSKEKEVLSVEIEELLESKATIFKNIEDREDSVSDMERDLGVMTRRLKKLYKKDYPDIKLNF